MEKKDQPYHDTRNNQPHRNTGNINERNNNVNVDSTSPASDQTIETANETGIGDAGWNDEKMAGKSQNHSSDA